MSSSSCCCRVLRRCPLQVRDAGEDLPNKRNMALELLDCLSFGASFVFESLPLLGVHQLARFAQGQALLAKTCRDDHTPAMSCLSVELEIYLESRQMLHSNRSEHRLIAMMDVIKLTFNKRSELLKALRSPGRSPQSCGRPPEALGNPT